MVEIIPHIFLQYEWGKKGIVMMPIFDFFISNRTLNFGNLIFHFAIFYFKTEPVTMQQLLFSIEGRAV
jgi:hypothetical protein